MTDYSMSICNTQTMKVAIRIFHSAPSNQINVNIALNVSQKNNCRLYAQCILDKL